MLNAAGHSDPVPTVVEAWCPCSAARAYRLMRMVASGEARDLWAQVYPALLERKPGLLGAVTDRTEAQVMLLGTIYALDLSSVIRFEHLEPASPHGVTRRLGRDSSSHAIREPLAHETQAAAMSPASDRLMRAQNCVPGGSSCRILSRSFKFQPRC